MRHRANVVALRVVGAVTETDRFLWILPVGKPGASSTRRDRVEWRQTTLRRASTASENRSEGPQSSVGNSPIDI